MVAEKYQEFFDFMYQNHNLILTISEMDEVILEAKKVDEQFKCRDCDKFTKEYRDGLCESCHKWHVDN